MGAYQGRALKTGPPARRPSWPWRGLLRVLAVALVLALAAHAPWRALSRGLAVVGSVQVEGAHYLDTARIQDLAGIHKGDDLFKIDPARARQTLMLDSRVARAEVARFLPRGVLIHVTERVPALLVSHGTPWELDSTGVLLEPLEQGAVADVPLLVGPSFAAVKAGSQIQSPTVARGLAWSAALSDPALQLAGQVSELDVSREDRTAITLLGGTRVLAPAWPPSTRRLSALRVVLGDLRVKGAAAEEVDVRFENQVIVRPAIPPGPENPNG